MLSLSPQKPPSDGGKQVLTLYSLSRSAKFILSRRPTSQGKKGKKGGNRPVKTVVIQSMSLGNFFCATGDDAVKLLGEGDNNKVVLKADEGLGCICMVSPPTFGETALGIGVSVDKHTPWTGVSTSSTIFLFVAKQVSIVSMFEGLAAYLVSCKAINCPPISPWPPTYNCDDMARNRAEAEASHTEAAIFESNTMSEQKQETLDRKIMSLCCRHFRHYLGVRQWCLNQPDYEDEDEKWWWIVWVIEHSMEVLADIHRDAAMRLSEPARLTRDMVAENITATCAGCKRKVKIEFNGDLTLNGKDHRDCDGPLANEVYEGLVAAQTVDDGGSKGDTSQVVMTSDFRFY